MIEILIADDSLDTQLLVKQALGDQYHLTAAHTVAEAMLKIKEKRFDLLILDVDLPDGDGFQICTQVRNADATRQVQVIFLTGKTGVANRVMGFSLGADDYIEKPFNAVELSARIKAKIDRLRTNGEKDSFLVKGDLRLHLLQQKVLISGPAGESEISLKPMEFKLLQHFMKNEDRVFSRQHLIDAVWGNATFIVDRTVDKHISSLRNRLGACAHYIQTVPSFGYRFSAAAVEFAKAG